MVWSELGSFSARVPATHPPRFFFRQCVFFKENPGVVEFMQSRFVNFGEMMRFSSVDFPPPTPGGILFAQFLRLGVRHCPEGPSRNVAILAEDKFNSRLFFFFSCGTAPPLRISSQLAGWIPVLRRRKVHWVKKCARQKCPIGRNFGHHSGFPPPWQQSKYPATH